MSNPAEDPERFGFNSYAESQSLKRPRPITSRMGLEDDRSKMTHSSQPVCLQFRRWGRCSYGDNCRYAHITEEPILGPWKGHGDGVEEDQRNVDKLKRCNFSFSGKHCPYGNNCIYLHAYDNMPRSDAIEPKSSVDLGKKIIKTKFCYLWQRDGSCTFGSNCQFAHGIEELQIGSSNPPESLSGISAPANGTGFNKPRFLFKWTNIQKISEVYADWIEMPIVPSGAVEN